MKKTIITILMILFSLSFISSMYAGNTYTYDTDIKELYWKVEGNSSNLNGLNISIEKNQIILSFALNFKPDKFNLTFYDNETKKKVVSYHGKGSNKGWIIKPTNQNKNNEKKNNYTNYTIPINPPEEHEKNFPIGLYFIIGIVVLAIIGFIIYLLNRNKIKKYKDFNDTEISINLLNEDDLDIDKERSK